MKKKLLFLLFMLSLFQISIYSWANELSTKQKIELKKKISDQHRSTSILPEAYIEGTLLSVTFSSVTTTATTTVKNAETGEIIYLSTDSNVDKIEFDLTEEKSGKYTLEIQVSDNTFEGDFQL